MTGIPDRLLHRLEWQVLHRVEGRLQGAHRTTARGPGLDFAGIRAYAEGGDARHIDWNVTARMAEPYVREFLQERDLTVWLLLDTSASMRAGMPGRGKSDVATALAIALARLFGRGGDRVGAVLYGAGATRIVPPGTGRGHALRIGSELERAAATVTAPGRPRGARRNGTTTDLAEMLGAAAPLATRRSLIVVVSDFIGTGDWQRPLLRLAHRHDVVALHVVDAVDEQLPAAGPIVVEDAETGEQLLVDSADPLFRARLRAGVEAREAALLSGARRAGVPVHRVDTGGDLVETLVEVITRTHEGRARSGRSPGGHARGGHA